MSLWKTWCTPVLFKLSSVVIFSLLFFLFLLQYWTCIEMKNWSFLVFVNGVITRKSCFGKAETVTVMFQVLTKGFMGGGGADFVSLIFRITWEVFICKHLSLATRLELMYCYAIQIAVSLCLSKMVCFDFVCHLQQMIEIDLQSTVYVCHFVSVSPSFGQ